MEVGTDFDSDSIPITDVVGCIDNRVSFSYLLFWNGDPKFGEADHRVVGGLQVGERSAQEVLQTGHVRQG